MNSIVLKGNITKELELKTTSGGTAILNFDIAVPRKFKREGQPDTDFFNCQSFGNTASFIYKHFGKGVPILIRGRIENNNWTNKEGQTVRSDRVSVEEAEFCERKSFADANAPADAPKKKPEAKKDTSFVDVPKGSEEELPFN